MVVSGMDPNRVIKNEIKSHMKSTGVMQKDLAQELGLTATAVSNVLNGSCRVLSVRAERILAALDLDVVVVSRKGAEAAKR
jgi:transcriptional regulator with XRE-family HTH domain